MKRALESRIFDFAKKQYFMELFMRKKNIKKTVIREILDLLPRWMIGSCAIKHSSEYGCSKYKTYDYLLP